MFLRQVGRGAAFVSALLMGCGTVDGYDPIGDIFEEEEDTSGDTGSGAPDDFGPLDTGGAVGDADPDEPPASGDNPAGTEAAALRSRLASLYAEHIYLVGIASKTARSGGDGGQAVASLDGNTSALAGEIAAMYGGSVADRYAAAWRSMSRNELDYSAALARGDGAGADAAEAAAFEDAAATVAILDAANDRLDPEWLGEWMELQVVDTLLLLDIEETQPTSQYDRYAWTVRKTQVVAHIVASAYDVQEPDPLPGDADAAEAALRALLAWLFVDSSYQTALLTWAEHGVGDAFAARKYMSEQSTARLALVIRDAYGSAAADAFVAAWDAQIDAIRLYAARRAAGASTGAARSSVEAAAQGVVSALSGTVPTLDAGRLSEALAARNEALLAAADAQAGGGSWTDDARSARVWSLSLGDQLAVGLYEHRPDYVAPSYGP